MGRGGRGRRGRVRVVLFEGGKRVGKGRLRGELCLLRVKSEP